MMTFLKIIRPVNLLIAIIGGLLFRWISVGSFGELLPLIAYLLGVVFIMIGGYLINDYYDYKTDSINKPNKLHFANRNTYSILFSILNVVAILLSLYCAEFKGFSSVPYVFTLAIALLWMYSYLLQVLPLIGNLTIAFLVILLYIPLKDGYLPSRLANLFMALSFIITLARELVKDLEDKKGDKFVGYKTLPIVAGNYFTKSLALCLIFIAGKLLYNYLWTSVVQNNWMLFLFIIVEFSLIVASLFILLSSDYIQFNKEYKRASLLLKISMFLFLLLIFMLRELK
jgi:4-hydroxybenzoate polyprenyltransferase